MKQGSLASVINSGNDVRSSVVSHGEATAPAGGLQGRPPGHLHQVQDGPPRWLKGASKGAGTGIGRSTQIVHETRRFIFSRTRFIANGNKKTVRPSC